jgi:hypothetical protein
MHNQIHPAPRGLTHALLRNRASEIIEPYLRYVEGWQLRLGYLRAQLSVHTPGSDEHDLAARRLEELRAEIASHRNFLIDETSTLPPDDRADAILDELDGLLRSISRAAVRAL